LLSAMVVCPEPARALISVAALASLALARRRQHARRRYT
jgi:hypothetical protein